MKAFKTVGMLGVCRSIDTYHVIIEKNSYRLKQTYLGGKLKLTCCSLTLACNHRRRIIHTTVSHPAR